ncbi:membrane protein [Humibacillus xanthopallidus]
MRGKEMSGGVVDSFRHWGSKAIAPTVSARPYWWILPLLIYTIFRAINVLMISLASQSEVIPASQDLESLGYFVTKAGPAPPGYLTTVTNWDGQWYWQIAEYGYPDRLPRNSSGQVIQNEFAFFPLFPILARALMSASGLSFPIVATTMSILLGAVCTLLLYRIVLRNQSDTLGALIAATCLSAFTCAPVFLIAYTDPLALTFVLLILAAVLRRKLAWAALLLMALAFTRNIVAAFAFFFAVLALIEWRRRRGQQRFVGYMLLSAWSASLTLAWPTVVALKTGEAGAYLVSQQAWVTDIALIAPMRFIQRYADVLGGPLTATVLAIAWIALVLRLVTIGQPDTTLRMWSLTYSAYILMATNWSPNGLRYYLLALPVCWPLATTELSSRRARVAGTAALALLGLLTQWWWIRYVLTHSVEGMSIP